MELAPRAIAFFSLAKLLSPMETDACDLVPVIALRPIAMPSSARDVASVPKAIALFIVAAESVPEAIELGAIAVACVP